MTDSAAKPRDYEEAAVWALERVLDFMDATYALFNSASSDDGWDTAVSRLQALYNSTLDQLKPVAERIRAAADVTNGDPQ